LRSCKYLYIFQVEWPNLVWAKPELFPKKKVCVLPLRCRCVLPLCCRCAAAVAVRCALCAVRCAAAVLPTDVL
jgi:hypothetical protein